MLHHRLFDTARAQRVLAVLAAATFVGCAQVPPRATLDPLWRDAAYTRPAQPLPGAAELLALSPAMRRFAQQQLSTLPPHLDPRRALVEALYREPDAGGQGLRLAYDASVTRSAAEAFEHRAGNCLSLVMMTAAFARHLGLAVSYQAVRTDEFYTRVGTLTLASSHVNLVLGHRPSRHGPQHSGAELLVVDFLDPVETRGQRTEPLDEATVLAMYFNNRAAELLAEGRTDAAYWHARAALAHDPEFLHAVNTLGVIHQRAGQGAAAELAFRHVLAQDAHAVTALSNLVALLRHHGRDAEAEPLAARLHALQPVPPLHWLHQGREALAAGDAATALTLLRRELRRQPEQDEVHFALAETHLRLGDLARAQLHLARAAEFSTRRTDQQRYETKLARLRASLATHRLE